jgi:hypothetical protein
MHLTDIARKVRAAREVRPHRGEEVSRAQDAVLGMPRDHEGARCARGEGEGDEVAVFEVREDFVEELLREA